MTDDTLYNVDHRLDDQPEPDFAEDQPGPGTIGKLVNDQEFYKNAKLSLQKVDKAADGLEDQGPLSVIGIMANQFGLVRFTILRLHDFTRRAKISELLPLNRTFNRKS